MFALAAEEEERRFYLERDLPDWHGALARLETDEHKEFLDVAPWLVVAFAQKHTPQPDGSLRKNYYVNESVGIACGLFIAALHTMGLATLTHTPNPMTFLTKVLDRPATERPYILFPIGYPADDCEVPVLGTQATSRGADRTAGLDRLDDGDLHPVGDGEAETLVEADRGGVGAAGVQERAGAGRFDARGNCPDQAGRQTLTPVRRVGAHGADLDIAGWPAPLPRHRDQPIPVAQPEIAARARSSESGTAPDR